MCVLYTLCVQEMYSSGAESSVLVWSPIQKVVRTKSVRGGTQVSVYMCVCALCVCGPPLCLPVHVMELSFPTFNFCSFRMMTNGVVMKTAEEVYINDVMHMT